ncbi:MAG TPA: protein kinase [Vicinamibacterales bacterium]|nr:protein kinase [Vicinamibacterales bacterium]
MTDDRWLRVRRLFETAVERPPSERSAFLSAVIADDEALRRDVNALLAADAAGASLSEWPVASESLLAELRTASSARRVGGPASPGLTAGDRLGNYAVVALLGAGGMGEVYRAHDARLGRDVAIKILPHALTTDPARLARFEREARVLAALNHPHIAGIHGIEQAGAAPALVLELVEGLTLADRITASRILLEEALTLGRQIADALSAAHDKGIIHRDLKPANVKVTPTGVVKVLDFGLAKTDGEGATPELAHSPTITLDQTRDGTILGTAAYMSPEQARGKSVDKRSDIWAFGCVLYEMLTGHKAFDRETVSDTITAILECEPNWRLLPAATPTTVRRLLQRCLEKDASRRLRDIGDACLELEDAIGRFGSRSLPRRLFDFSRERWLAAVGAVVAVSIAVIAGWFWPTWALRPAPAAVLHPTFTQITSQSGLEWFPSLSPDGKWVVYGADTEGNRDIILQSTTGQTPINLTPDSADDDDQPVFSPDGERIAFTSSRDGGGIFVMGRTGESVTRLTRRGFGPTWGPGGRELAFTTESADLDPQNTLGLSSLWVVDVASGEQRQLGNVDAVLPSWSPHGHRIAYTTRGAIAGSTRLDIWTVDRFGANAIAVTTDGARNWNPVWAPDGRHLYFVSGRGGPINLWRVPIDETSGRTTGLPEAVTTPAPFVAHITISADGTRIAYSSILRSRNIQKLRIDPATGTPRGEATWITTGSRLWANPDPSPDGKWVVFYSSVQPEGDLYIARTDGTGLRQLTSGTEPIDRMPRWSPDSQWIAFHSIRGKDQYLWKIRPDGSQFQQLSPLADAIYPAWSPDSSRIAVLMAAGIGHSENNVYVFDPNRPWIDQKPEVIPPPAESPDEFVVNAWSPDGSQLAGQAGLAARGIITYSLRSRRYERLTDFGGYPVWLPDSRHLMFVSGGRDFYVVDTRSRKVEKVFSVPGDIIGPPQLTRDGREAYFSRRVTEGDIWLLATNESKTSP